jgi:hypothetical protein
MEMAEIGDGLAIPTMPTKVGIYDMALSES